MIFDLIVSVTCQFTLPSLSRGKTIILRLDQIITWMEANKFLFITEVEARAAYIQSHLMNHRHERAREKTVCKPSKNPLSLSLVHYFNYREHLKALKDLRFPYSNNPFFDSSSSLLKYLMVVQGKNIPTKSSPKLSFTKRVFFKSFDSFISPKRSEEDLYEPKCSKERKEGTLSSSSSIPPL